MENRNSITNMTQNPRRNNRRERDRNGNGNRIVKYYCTFQNTIADVLATRGWQEVKDEYDWDFIWGDRELVYQYCDKVMLLLL